MRMILVLLLALACLHLAAEERYASAEPEFISERIVELIDVSRPLILNIQAGDLPPRLDFLIRGLLLSQGADLRESDPLAGSAFSAVEGDSLDGLAPFALQSLNLVSIGLELGGTTVEHKNFLSYRSERYPLYTFQVKQISLPGYKLLHIDELSFTGSEHGSAGPSLSSLKWFEPVLATTALASLIYLLWTIE